jgi:hypothetical protein
MHETPSLDTTTAARPRVWIPAALRGVHSTRDISPLMRFGELKYCYPVQERNAPSLRSDVAYKEILNALVDGDFDPDADFVCLPGGDPLAAMLVGVALAELGCEYVTLLRYDRSLNQDGTRSKEGRYIPVQVNLCADLSGEDENSQLRELLG